MHSSEANAAVPRLPTLYKVYNDTNFIKQHNELRDIPYLTKVLYSASDKLLDSFGRHYFHCFKDTFNPIICTAHMLQLSVKFNLNKAKISFICNKIRNTVRFFRKSSITLFHLKRAFENSNDFKNPLCLLLYVKTRWGFHF